ncbi:MAG: glycoside hydrolase family 15 protein [Dehalococcoidia bacterium]
MTAYQPIENYGLIGDLHTAALVGSGGAIDWLCLPHFDSPSVFAAVLDAEKGGRFLICPTGEDFRSKQSYWPDTNVLVTRFLSDDGVGEVTDFMPITVLDEQRKRHQIVRRVRAIKGTIRFQAECEPALDYGRAPHTVEVDDHGARFVGRECIVGLASRHSLSAKGNGVHTEFVLHEGEATAFVFGQLDDESTCAALLDEGEALALVEQTVAYWRGWLSRCTYQGRWREMVQRSALALKLMTFEPTGAIVAAPTTSLPEAIGGSRNWDYRYTWIRDAAFTLYAFMRLGFTDEAAQFTNWLEERIHDCKEEGSLQIMYGIDGRAALTEENLDHLEGYRGSRPVRIGNGAHDQLQLDIYGELLDSIYLFNKHGSPISYELWTHVQAMVEWLCDNWHLPDEGIWETRGGHQHFVYSKLMSWVALDRALRLADKRSFPADRERWRSVRDEIMVEVMEKGWDPERDSFVQAYDSQALDASNLMMPLVFFLSPSDPRFAATLEATLRAPSQGGLTSNGLVYRYNPSVASDGLPGNEGTFNICTFWLVEALSRAGRTDRRRLEQARLLFEEMLGYANHLGLYAEEIGPRGEALGNFPQALTHLGLITAAFSLDRELAAAGVV